MWLWNILTKVIFFNDLLSFFYSHGSFDETFHEPHRHKSTMKTGNGVTKLSMELSHMPPVKSLSHTHTHTQTHAQIHTWFPKPLTPLGWGIWKTSALPCQSGQLGEQRRTTNRRLRRVPETSSTLTNPVYLPLICSSASHMPCWGNPSLPSQNSIQKLKSSKRDIWNGHVTWMNSDTCDWMESLVWSLLIGSGLHFLIWICWYWWRPPVQWTRHPLTADKQ